jgi:transposase
MVGKKTHQPKKHFSFNLEERVPEDNLYRKLKEVIDWEFLYEAVAPYYGTCGHQSIDPVVFFKFMLIGYLENLHSDRAIIRVSQLRLDILYFTNYNLDEELPWHSTLSRTRQHLPEEVFEQCFKKVLSLCIEAGMVEGDTQAIDAAYIEANACLENMQKILS